MAEIVPGRAAEHALRLDPDGVHLAGALVDRDHGRLGEHDAAPAHVDERVRSPEVDGHLAPAEPAQVAPEAHEDLDECNDKPERVHRGHVRGLTP